MNPDIVNSLFEGGGACLLFMNVRRLYQDKKLAGVALEPTIWFNIWGAWNLLYYERLHQTYSWLAGIGVFVMNTTWVFMALYYRAKAKEMENRLHAKELVYCWGEEKPLMLTLSDGRYFRADPPGVNWYEFPILVRAPDQALEAWLDSEFLRLRGTINWTPPGVKMIEKAVFDKEMIEKAVFNK